jgi:putative spermidine/putrescine transport system permease protein
MAWSLWVAAVATALATIAATAVATLFRSGTRSSGVARFLAVMPLPLPHVAAGVLGVLVLGQSGLLARGAFIVGWIDQPAAMPAIIYDRWGIGLILVLAWKEFPFLALIAFSLLAGRGRELEEAARTLGAHQWSVFRTVTWPVLWRGLMPAVVAVFAFVAGTYEATVLLAPSDPLALPLLTIERYTDVGVASRGEAHVLVLMGLLAGLGAVALHEAARAWERRGA